MTKNQIDALYITQASTLEQDFFLTVYEKDADDIIIGQHRELKDGKSIDDFNQLHAEIWQAHDAALIAAGYRDPPPPEPPPNPDVVRFQEIIATSPAVITMPEMWEAIRILGRLII